MDTIEKVLQKDKIKIGVHDSIFHSDEVMALALLRIIKPNSIEYTRTRDPKVLEKMDMRIDVGMKYDPETLDFDHHQSDFNERNEAPTKNSRSTKYEVLQPLNYGPKLCGFGLVYRHFGRYAISKIVSEMTKDLDYSKEKKIAMVKYIFYRVMSDIVIPIDATDNGEDMTFNMNNGDFRVYPLSRVISTFNPQGSDLSDTVYHKQCMDRAIEVGMSILTNEFRNFGNTYMSFDVLEDKINNMGPDGILVLKEFVPWGTYFSDNREFVKNVKMLIFPGSTGNEWLVRTPNYYHNVDKENFSYKHLDGSQRRHKYPIPKCLLGASEEDVLRITGIEDVVFLHNAGFISSCKTEQSALLLAHWIIHHQDN